MANVSTADGANIQTWSWWGGDGQQFRFEDAGSGTYRIIARHSGKCIEVENSSTADGANVQQMSCNGGSSQRFEVINNKSEAVNNLSSGFGIYPNPAISEIIVNVPNDFIKNSKISVYNNLGKLVYEDNIIERKSIINIS